MLDLGVIGYGVRMDMLMDNLFSLGREVRIKAVADHNPRRVRDLMTKDESAAERYAMELDKIDANLRECRMDPDGITFYHDAGDMPAGLRCSQCEKQDTCMESSYNIVQVRNDTPRSDWCCYARDTGNEDSGTLILRYESGMHAMYSQNFFARKAAARRGARLYGYKGTVEFDFVSQKIFIYDHMSDKVTQISVPIPARGHGGGDTALMKNFVDLCEGKTDRSAAPLADGIKSAQVCLAAKDSAEEEAFKKIVL